MFSSFVFNYATLIYVDDIHCSNKLVKLEKVLQIELNDL